MPPFGEVNGNKNMDMQTGCSYGFGFKVNASDEQLKRFILAHKESLLPLNATNGLENQGRDLIDYCENTPEKEFNPKEDWCDYTSGVTGHSGVYGAISDIMMAETGISFGYFEEQDSSNKGSIMLEQLMPWDFNETEKALTEESLQEICEKYIAELNPELEFESIRMEYFG